MPAPGNDVPDLPVFVPWAGPAAAFGLAWAATGIAAVYLAASTGGQLIGSCVTVIGLITIAAAAVGRVADHLLSRSAGETGPPEDHS